VFTWCILLLIPATISTYAPSAKRAIGTLPAIAMMVAIGIINLWSIVRRWTSRISVFSGKMMKSVYAILLISGFIYSGIVTYRDYFIIWAANPNLFTHFEVGISMMGDYIQTLAPNERIYVSPDNPQHPGIRYHSLLRENVYGYNGRVCLVLPERTTTGTSYIIAPSKDKLSLERIQTHFPQGQIVHEGPLHYGEPYFRVFHIPEQNTAYIAPTHPISIRWDANIQITGFDLKKTEYHPDETISLNLYYMATEPVSLRYTAFIHLLGANNPDNGTPLWAQNDSEPCSACYPTSMWKTDEIVIDTVELYLPANIPVGTYSLATGFYYLPTMERIKVVEGDAADNVVTLSTISVSN
jgi:hypothetical protein